MSLFLTIFIAFIGILSGKLIFKYWFNPLAAYTFVWGGMIFLYELKLLDYIDIIPEAWFVIIVSYIIFFIGCVTPLAIYKKDKFVKNSKLTIDLLFKDDGKIFAIVLYTLGFISLAGALWNWYVLLNIFGSFTRIFISANDIYHMRVSAEIPGLLPYMGGFGYAGLILAGIYTVYKGKITLAAVILLVAVILRDMSNFARIGILISFVIYICSLFLYKNYSKKSFSASRVKMILVMIVALILIVVSASIVRLFRGSYETYKGSKTELSEFKGNLIISPSVYLYLSAHIGVFSKYLDLESEQTRFGENTLQPAYNLLAKFHLTEKVSFFQKGYYIPMWTNSSTYLRELHSDFGYLGLFIGPYVLSFLTSLFWIKFYRYGGIYDFMILSVLMAMVTMSFFSMIIRSPDCYFAMIILCIIIPFIKRSANKNLSVVSRALS
jgi:oligosaccharide repeat unit polymerase